MKTIDVVIVRVAIMVMTTMLAMALPRRPWRVGAKCDDCQVNVEIVGMVLVGGYGKGVHDCGAKRGMCSTGADCAIAYTASAKVYKREGPKQRRRARTRRNAIVW